MASTLFYHYAHYRLYIRNKYQEYLLSQGHNMETEKEVNDNFFDRVTRKEIKEKDSLTFIQRKHGHHKPVHLNN